MTFIYGPSLSSLSQSPISMDSCIGELGQSKNTDDIMPETNQNEALKFFFILSFLTATTISLPYSLDRFLKSTSTYLRSSDEPQKYEDLRRPLPSDQLIRPSGIFGNVRKDVSRYSSIFMRADLNVTMMLENIVNEVYTGIYHINATLIFYEFNHIASNLKINSRLGFVESRRRDQTPTRKSLSYIDEFSCYSRNIFAANGETVQDSSSDSCTSSSSSSS